MSEFKGILFTLKKREPGIKEADAEHFCFLLYGFYDGLDVNTIENWYEFSPRGLEQLKLHADMSKPFIDQYTIRALVPENAEELQKKGFAYNFWNEIGSKKEADEWQENYPFICMSMLNLTEEFVKENKGLNKLQDSIVNLVLNSVDNSKESLQELHCAVYPLLGYSDFVVVFQTDELKKAANVISKLRSGKTSVGKGAVSNCYSVCGIHKKYVTDGMKIDNNKLGNVGITIRLNLNSGITPEMFLKALEAEIESGKKDETNSQTIAELNKLLDELRKYFYIAFGNSDCLLLPEQTISQYLRLHASGNILNPGSVFFQKYISTVRTSVRVKTNETIDNINIQLPDYLVGKENKTEVNSFITEYEKFLEDKHKRSSKALQRLMKNHENIAGTLHGFDVRHILGDAFKSLTESVSQLVEKYKKISQNNIVQKVSDRQKIFDAVEHYKNCAGDFLADIIRSDKLFIEGNMLTHPAIGSATKLIFAYNAMLEQLLKNYKRAEDFTFVVISGGCDKTTVDDLFSFTEPEERIKKVILLFIPEMSLYDVQGTLFRMLHEYMHFIGDRRRKERFTYIIQALAGSIAHDICKLDFNEERLKEFQTKATLHLSSSMGQEIKGKIKHLFDVCKEQARDIIAKEIRGNELFSEYQSKLDEKDYYSYELQNSVLNKENFAQIFQIDMKESVCIEGCLFRKICDILAEMEQRIIEQIYNLLGNYKEEISAKEEMDEDKGRIAAAEKSYYVLLQNYMVLKKDGSYRDDKTSRFIEKYFESFFGNFSILRDEEFEMDTFCFIDVQEAILVPMVECFADCSSIKLLGMPKEDFLLAFIYESWDVDVAFPFTDDNILRVGADFAVAYQIKPKTEEEISSVMKELSDCVRAKVKKREHQGYVYDNVDEMLARIEEILKAYVDDRYYGLSKNLEDYLIACMSGIDEDKGKEIKELYQLSNMESPEDIYKMADKMIRQWQSL